MTKPKKKPRQPVAVVDDEALCSLGQAMLDYLENASVFMRRYKSMSRRFWELAKEKYNLSSCKEYIFDHVSKEIHEKDLLDDKEWLELYKRWRESLKER